MSEFMPVAPSGWEIIGYRLAVLGDAYLSHNRGGEPISVTCSQDQESGCFCHILQKIQTPHETYLKKLREFFVRAENGGIILTGVTSGGGDTVKLKTFHWRESRN